MSMNSASVPSTDSPVSARRIIPEGASSPDEAVAVATPAAKPTADLAQLPRSPDEGAPLLTFQEIQYKDGGAHWYRASAIILRHHK